MATDCTCSSLPPQLDEDNIDWGEPIIEELFEGTELNRSLFDVEVTCWGGGNREKQCYLDRPENLRVENGRLVIEAVRGEHTGTLEGSTNNYEGSATWTQPFTSARIRTLKSPAGSWKYGRFEVRAQMPRGDFLWPAIWMLPTDEVHGIWAASGEIDIIEYRGQEAFKGAIEATIHYGSQVPHNKMLGTGCKTIRGIDYSEAMHDYALEWTADLTTGRPKLMRWLVDGVEHHRQDLNRSWKSCENCPYTQDGQPWDQRFHLLINLAVGGGFFPADEFGGFTTPAEYDAAVATWTRPRFEIEHVKVWAWPPKAAT